jgi:CheY-like chemotaxis protein
VDDDAAALALRSAVLSSAGYEVLTAAELAPKNRIF